MSQVLSSITRHAKTKPTAAAISDGRITITYQQLGSAIDQVAKQILATCPGDAPIAFNADNSIGWVLVDLACVKLNRTLVPLPPFFTRAQVEHAIKQTGAGAILSDAAEASPAATKVQAAGTSYSVTLTHAQRVHLPGNTGKVTYTSGTTGTPKGVCLSQAGLEQTSLSLVDAIGAEYAGTHFAILPLGVLLENAAGLYTTLIAGGLYYVVPLAQAGFAKAFQPDFPKLVSALAQAQANSAILVPELLRGLMQALASTNNRLASLKLVAVGGAKVSPSLLEMAKLLQLPVFQGYGLSEAGSVVALNTPSSNQPGSVGKMLRHVSWRLLEDGEIVLNDPGFLGYAGEPTPQKGYPTGDIGRLDDQGFLYIEGRKKNVLITSYGRNVSPEWVESELLSCPQVGQAFVYGESRPALGALVVPSSLNVTDAELDAAIGRVNSRLPEYAQIHHWSKVFPFTPSNGLSTANGRLRRPEINAAHAQQIDASYMKRGQHITFFERLVSETAIERAYLMETPQIRDGLQGRISLQSYRMYLAEAYHHVRHTVPLLTKVRDGLPDSKAWLKQACQEYIAEESGHEEWILDDIRNSGGDATSVRASLPKPATEFMVAYAYDYVARVNPAGFFGMVFVLEGTSTQLATAGAQALMNSLRLPANCFRYLTSHGTLDISHMQFFQSLMNRIEDPKDQADIIHMAKRMFLLFADVFRSIPHDMAVQNAA